MSRRPSVAREAEASEARWLASLRAEQSRHPLDPSLRDILLTALRQKLAGWPELARWLADRPIRIAIVHDPRRLGLGTMGGHRLGPFGDSTIVLNPSYPGVDLLHTFLHELGHHVHVRTRDRRVDRTIRRAFRRKASAVCSMADQNPPEYFAESLLVHWVEPETLEKRDPIGAAMVRDVLALVGLAGD